ncbi:MAG: hypothetical protein ACI9LN_004124 [Saprospiraceae bacterium]|jgi:hypothetical protein
MKISTQIALYLLLLSSSLVAQTIQPSSESSRITNFFALNAPNLTATFFDEIGLVEICFDGLQLHSGLPHYLIIPEERFENKVLTHAPLAVECLYFKVGHAIDLISIDSNSQVVVILLESVRRQ